MWGAESSCLDLDRLPGLSIAAFAFPASPHIDDNVTAEPEDGLSLRNPAQEPCPAMKKRVHAVRVKRSFVFAAPCRDRELRDATIGVSLARGA